MAVKEAKNQEKLEDLGPGKAQVEELQENKGIRVERRFTTPGVSPFDEVQWEKRTALIQNDKGEVIFEQTDIDVPDFWSQLATNVVSSKYFRGKPDSEDRETSIRQLISRVVKQIVEWGIKQEYFAGPEDQEAFDAELTHLLLFQKLSFNSPVWFNVGVEEHPQCSACFINSIEDSMSSILDLAKTEGMLFKWGSGSGTNLSPLRSSRESVAGGGKASGPVSFMRGFDAFAGVIKSGGKTRRAAKMVILNAEHPDIRDFVACKVEEEKKAWALIDAGYDGSFSGEAYNSVFFQNSNNSVRVPDEFMHAAVDDRKWSTRAVKTRETIETFPARDLLRQISEATHICGDPGLQFDTTVNTWHTCPNSGRINASNPCSEYMFLDDTACNLASLNLLKFIDDEGVFDCKGFRDAVRISILAQEIVVDNASYPRPRIAQRSHDYRTLGLGYANLGALLMAQGLAYDSDAGREYAGALTALMTGEAYRVSAEIAESMGPFPHYRINRQPMLSVIAMHQKAAEDLETSNIPEGLFKEVKLVWEEALKLGEKHGYRNAQVTVLAPTGTIAFMMDCDTTGVEPDIALVKYKKLVGGGLLKIVNHTVPRALKKLGYSEKEVGEIIEYIDEHGTIEGAPGLLDEHLPVFDCAFKPENGNRSIHYMGHVRMMGATQPFISGAISKTVNMPQEATVDEIMETYIEAWRQGLKAVAIYRDNSKRTQPLNTGLDKKKEEEKQALRFARRRRLPDERPAITHKFSVGGHEGYITVGTYEENRPGEVFIKMSKEGSTISGLVDCFATAVSLALQYGVPLEVLVNKFTHTRFEPSGVTNNPQIRFAKSIMDYVFRYLGYKFPLDTDAPQTPVDPAIEAKAEAAVASVTQNMTGGSTSTLSASSLEESEKRIFLAQADAPPCSECGSIMVRNGSCYKCLNCGSTSGCS
ncbi:MAG: vitamin B12-dependent ribonucleotide reductase [Candidatus Omnitrophica bacterium]|nr:vitamin B12-dependent ribonucleotide reductase [Candidatus Omnitrophota bacterium]